MFSRRDFLKSSTSLVALSGGGMAVVVPTAARAEIATTVLTAVQVARTITALFNRSNAQQRAIAQLTARMDAMIDLQRTTLDAIAAIERQLSDLRAEIPQMLRNQRLEELNAMAGGLLDDLQGIAGRIESASLSDNSAQEIVSLLQAITNDARNVASESQRSIRSMQASDDVGIQTCCLAAAALHALSLVVPTVKAIEEELLIREIDPPNMNVTCLLINESVRLASDHLRTSLVHDQRRWQERELRGRGQEIESDRFMNNWREHLVFPPSNNVTRSDVQFHGEHFCPSRNSTGQRPPTRDPEFVILGTNYSWRVDVRFRYNTVAIGENLGIESLRWEFRRIRRSQFLVDGFGLPGTTPPSPRSPLPRDDRARCANWTDDDILSVLDSTLRTYRNKMIEQTARRAFLIALRATRDWSVQLERTIDENRSRLDT